MNFSTVFGYTATLGHTLTQAELPNVNFTGSTSTDGAHTHQYDNQRDNSAQADAGGARNVGNDSNAKTTSSGGSHSHTVTVASGGSDSAHSHSIDMRVRYVDVIACSKD